MTNHLRLLKKLVYSYPTKVFLRPKKWEVLLLIKIQSLFNRTQKSPYNFLLNNSFVFAFFIALQHFPSIHDLEKF